jgi:hypothetical protein
VYGVVMLRFSSSAGIAIGPILFVLAIMGVIAMAMSSNIGNYGTAGIIDRVSADTVAQANLIRTKINECNLFYGTNSNGDGWPDSAGAPLLVSTATCTGDTGADGTQNGNLWSGQRVAQLPLPTAGFDNWYYFNGGDSAGRCIWINSKPGNKTLGINQGLQKAASKFTSDEVKFNPSTANDHFTFVVILTPAKGTISSNCTAP